MTTAAVGHETPPAVRVGLEPLGTDVLIEGEIRSLAPDEIVIAAPAMLTEGTRAFIVIADSDALPIVGLVEIVDQQVVIDDVIVELRARFVRLSNANFDRLAALCAPKPR